jgi:hypothetical protein
VALLFGVSNLKRNPSDAPVSIPFIWNAPQLGRIQYNGMASKFVVAASTSVDWDAECPVRAGSADACLRISEGKHGAETAQSNQEIWIELKGSAIGRDGLVMVPKPRPRIPPSIQCEYSSASSSRIAF